MIQSPGNINKNELPTAKPCHYRCPKCGHYWSRKGPNSEVSQQHCEECGWDWKGPSPWASGECQ